MPPKASGKGAKKAGKAKGPPSWKWWKEKEEKKGKLRHLHLQGVEASSPRHWYLQPCYEHHEQLCQWYLRTYCWWSFSSCTLQQEVDHHQSRGTDCCPSPSARWVGQTCCQRGYQGCYQVHHIQVDCVFPTPQTALFRATICSKKRLWPIQLCSFP